MSEMQFCNAKMSLGFVSDVAGSGGVGLNPHVNII